MNFASNPLLASRVLSIVRIVVAFLILQHGTAKLFHFPHVAYFDNLQIFSLLGLAGIIECVGGLLLLVGLFTRVAGFILSGELAFAYFMGHASKGFVLAPSMNGGEPAVLFCFIFLLFAAAGGGIWSVDAMMAKNKAAIS